MPTGKLGSGIENWVKDVNLEYNKSSILCNIMPLFFFVDLNNVRQLLIQILLGTDNSNMPQIAIKLHTSTLWIHQHNHLADCTIFSGQASY